MFSPAGGLSGRRSIRLGSRRTNLTPSKRPSKDMLSDVPLENRVAGLLPPEVTHVASTGQRLSASFVEITGVDGFSHPACTTWKEKSKGAWSWACSPDGIYLWRVPTAGLQGRPEKVRR